MNKTIKIIKFRVQIENLSIIIDSLLGIRICPFWGYIFPFSFLITQKFRYFKFIQIDHVYFYNSIVVIKVFQRLISRFAEFFLASIQFITFCFYSILIINFFIVITLKHHFIFIINSLERAKLRIHIVIKSLLI